MTKHNHNSADTELLYKFMSLSNFRRFVDILLYNRIYGATYRELNDPMECAFVHCFEEDNNLYQQLKRVRICSFMTDARKNDKNDVEPYNNILMWSHYADSHKGVCLELEYSKAYNYDWERIGVTYSDTIPRTSGNVDQDIRDIISTKARIWEKENEVRYVRIYRDDKSFQNNSPFLHIKLRAIYIGNKVKGPEVANLYKLIQKLNDYVKVYWMQHRLDENTYSGFLPRNLKEKPVKV